jgi:hypothetical protein
VYIGFKYSLAMSLAGLGFDDPIRCSRQPAGKPPPVRYEPRRGTIARQRGTIPQVNPEHEMKSRTEYLTFNLPERLGFVNITPQVEQVVRASGIREGLVLCNKKHRIVQEAPTSGR